VVLDELAVPEVLEFLLLVEVALGGTGTRARLLVMSLEIRLSTWRATVACSTCSRPALVAIRCTSRARYRPTRSNMPMVRARISSIRVKARRREALRRIIGFPFLAQLPVVPLVVPLVADVPPPGIWAWPTRTEGSSTYRLRVTCTLPSSRFR